MIEAAEIQVLIDGLARRFEGRPQRDESEFGWGQFLDGPPLQRQVGPYGTCAGLIVRSLAKRGADQLAVNIGRTMSAWWEHRNDSVKGRMLFGQTTRLAMFNLALRLARLPGTEKTAEEVRTTLRAIIRPDKMWGNYSIAGIVEDPSPRLFPTAISLLSFSLFNDNPVEFADFAEVADHLEEKLLGTKDLPLLHVAAASAAILGVKGEQASARIRRHMTRVAYRTQAAIRELGVYFYDYEYTTDDGETKFDRDYFIVPTEIVMGIAGFQHSAPSFLRLRSESSLGMLVENIRGFDGFYRPDNEQRVSSVNQCWVAMYLALAEIERDRVAGRRGLYALVRQRPDYVWLDGLLLLFSSAAIVIGSVVSFPDSSWKGGAVKACVAVLAFLAGRLYAPIFVKRFFPGREGQS